MDNTDIELTTFNDEMLHTIRLKNTLVAKFCCFVCLKKWESNVSWKNYNQSCGLCGSNTKPIKVVEKQR